MDMSHGNNQDHMDTHDSGDHGEHMNRPQPLLSVADFNGDSVVNDVDLADLNSRIDDSDYHPLYDLNADSVLDDLDVQRATSTLNQTVPLLDQQIAQVTQATMKYYGEGGLERAIANGYGAFTQEIFGHGVHYFNPFIANRIGNATELVIEEPVGLNYDAEGNLKAVFYIRLPKLLSGTIQNPLNAFALQEEFEASGQVAVDPDDDFPPSSFDTLSAEDWHTHENFWYSGIGIDNFNPELIFGFEDNLPDEVFNGRVSEAIENEKLFFPLSDTQGSPKFWMLHAWVHSLNTSGTFANTNPEVSVNAVQELEVHHGSHTMDDAELLIAGTDEPETINGTPEGDLINSFDGDDEVFALSGEDFVWSGRGNDLIEGGEGEDEVYGGPDNDILRGNGGEDRVFGGTGDDQLEGNEGDDLLRGSIGNDSLTGNSGRDHFVLAPTEGTDTITDFEIGVDKLLLENGLVIEQLSITQSSENTLIEFNNETLAILSEVDSSEINPDEVFTYEFKNTPVLDDSLLRFHNEEIIGTYLFAGREESENIRDQFPNFNEEGMAFNVSFEAHDDLVRFNRFRHSDNSGYLFANEEESVSIRENFPKFEEEGIAFYAHGANSNQGHNIYRFQNTLQPGAYIFVHEAEKDQIMANFPQFELEGIAFEAAM